LRLPVSGAVFSITANNVINPRQPAGSAWSAGGKQQKKALGGSVQEPEKSTADFSGVSSQKGSGHVKK